MTLDLKPSKILYCFIAAWVVRMAVLMGLGASNAELADLALLDLLAFPIVPVAIVAVSVLGRMPFSALAFAVLLLLPIILGGYLTELYGGKVYSETYAAFAFQAAGVGATLWSGHLPRVFHAVVGTFVLGLAVHGPLVSPASDPLRVLLHAAPYVLLWTVALFSLLLHKRLRARADAARSASRSAPSTF